MGVTVEVSARSLGVVKFAMPHSPFAATHNQLDFSLAQPYIGIAAMHKCIVSEPSTGAINVRDPGANSSGPEGQRRIAPRRSECPVRRVREAGEHQCRRGEERLRRL